MALTKITSTNIGSNAVANSIGYTPANKAGDTFSGSVTFSSNVTMSATTLLIDKGTNTSTIWSRDSTNSQFAFDHQSGNTVSLQSYHGSSWYDTIKLNPGGRVTMPQQPAFFAVKTDSSAQSTYVSNYQTVYVNKGNHFNASTGIFTAPVAGTYAFYVYQLMAPTVSMGHTDNWIAINDTLLGGYWIRSTTITSEYLPTSTVVLRTMAANDTARYYNQNGANLYSDGNGWIKFIGYLLG